MNFDQQLHFLERQVQSGGDSGGPFAAAVHAQGVGPFLQIEARARRRRTGRGGGLPADLADLLLERLQPLLEGFDDGIGQTGGGCRTGADEGPGASQTKETEGDSGQQEAGGTSQDQGLGAHRMLRRRSWWLAICWMRTP